MVFKLYKILLKISPMMAIFFDKRVIAWSHKNYVFPSMFLADSETDSQSCRTTFQFEVTHAMAPLSHLLVFYVRHSTEGVADTMVIPVEPKFENEVRNHNFFMRVQSFSLLHSYFFLVSFLLFFIWWYLLVIVAVNRCWLSINNNKNKIKKVLNQ